MKNGVVVFVHGFMGSKRQFDHLFDIPGVYNWDSCAIVLPGHESDINNFIKYRTRDWQYHLDNRLDALRKEYSRLIIVTHSMGGLLAINSYVKCSDNICGILSLSFPLHIMITRRCIRIQRAILNAPSENEDIFIETARRLSSVSGIALSNFIYLLPSGVSFLRLMFETRRVIKDITLPLHVVNSDSDELVSKRVVKFLKRNCPSVVVNTVSSSSHCCFCNSDKFFIENKLVKLLESARF